MWRPSMNAAHRAPVVHTKPRICRWRPPRHRRFPLRCPSRPPSPRSFPRHPPTLAGLRDDPSRVATALDQAHRDAAAIKAAEDIETADDKVRAHRHQITRSPEHQITRSPDRWLLSQADHHTSLATKVWMVSSVAPSDDNPPPTAPAGGGPAGGGPAARADPAPSEGMQASAESALGRACAAAAEAGEALAQGVASADQSATTAARDAVATAAGAASAAGGAAADVAAKPADMAKSVVDAVRAGFKVGGELESGHGAATYQYQHLCATRYQTSKAKPVSAGRACVHL